MTDAEGILKAAENAGVALSDRSAEALSAFKTLLTERNKQMNLTAITDDEGVFVKHFADSFTVLPVLARLGFAIDKPLKLIDVGSGAGLPGVPVACAAPSFGVTLLDSLNKRVNFLKEAAGICRLPNITPLCARAEEAGRDAEFRSAFDVCVCRAVARLPILAEICLPFVKVGGVFAAMKGDCEEEAREAARAITEMGGQLVEIAPVTLYYQGESLRHSVVCVRKTRQTPPKYPRAYAQIVKKPIM